MQPEISDVDAVAEDAHGGCLQVQVTRAEHGAWEAVARTGRTESVETDERRAAAIWDAIAKKSTRILQDSGRNWCWSLMQSVRRATYVML